jgi:hypothetical protein
MSSIVWPASAAARAMAASAACVPGAPAIGGRPPAGGAPEPPKHAPDPIPYCAGNGRQHSPSGAANGSLSGCLAPIVFRVGFGRCCRSDCAGRCACSGPTKESRSGRDARSERNITRRCEVSGEARSVEPVAASAGASSFVLCLFGFDAVVYPAFTPYSRAAL